MSLGSFFKDVESEVAHLFKSPTSTLTVASTAINLAAPFVDELVEATAGAPAEAEAAGVLDKIKSDLAGLSLLVQAGGTSPSIGGLLTDIQTNLGTIEEVGQIKDPALITKINGITTLLIGEIQAIAAAIGKPLS